MNTTPQNEESPGAATPRLSNLRPLSKGIAHEKYTIAA